MKKLIIYLFVVILAISLATALGECRTIADCPKLSHCEDATVNCIQNVCFYQSKVCTQTQIFNDLEVYGSLAVGGSTIEKISTGETRAVFSTDRVIAGNVLSVSPPVPYIAGKEFDKLSIFDGSFITTKMIMNEKSTCNVYDNYLPLTKNNCYKVNLNWGNYGFKEFDNGELKNYSQYLTIKYVPFGSGVYHGQKTHLELQPVIDENGDTKLKCIRTQKIFDYEYIHLGDCYNSNDNQGDYNNQVEMTFKDAIEIKKVEYNEKVTLNSPQTVKITLKNNLNVDLIPSGFKIAVIQNGLGEKQSQEQKQPFIFSANSENTYEIVLPTNYLGQYIIDIVPYFTITDGNDYLNEKTTISYYVSNEVKDCIQEPCKFGSCVSGVCTVLGDCEKNISSCLIENAQSNEEIFIIPIINASVTKTNFGIVFFLLAILVIVIIFYVRKNRKTPRKNKKWKG